MALIDPLVALSSRLATDPGWVALMAAHGLDLKASNLAKSLSDPLTINRKLLGFGDFSEAGTRGIEPGAPARSLFYHAIASPNVLKAPDGTPLTVFPTPAEMDAVEN